MWWNVGYLVAIHGGITVRLLIIALRIISNKYCWQRLIPNKIKNVFRQVWNDVKDVWMNIFKVFSNHEKSIKSSEDYINHSMYFEAKTFLHGLTCSRRQTEYVIA